MAIGSRRNWPTLPVAAAVVSLLVVAARNVPCSQSKDSVTRGTTLARRPPNRMASIGTPFGSSHSFAITGHCLAGVVKRAFGWAAGRPESGVHGRRSQSTSSAGLVSVIPSHQTSPSGVMAQFVKMEFFVTVSMAFGFDFMLVPGATPKNPASGLIAYRRPSGPNFIHAMSSPIVSTFQPGTVEISIARFVLPQATGNAPVMYFVLPSGFVNFNMSMCSASQPSSRAWTDAILSAWHFFPSNAFPPYPEPKDQISRVSGKWQIYLCSELHGHDASCSLGPRGAPTECRPFTKSPATPKASRTLVPTRDMMCMFATTYGESLISTPILEIGEPNGPIQYGMTYIVRPRIEAVKRSMRSRFIRTGSSQLFVGPASSSVSEQMKVWSSTRATSMGVDRT